MIDCSFDPPLPQRIAVVGQSGRLVLDASFTAGKSDAVVRRISWRSQPALAQYLPALLQPFPADSAAEQRITAAK